MWVCAPSMLCTRTSVMSRVGVGRGDAVGAGVVGAAVVDVVARGHQVRGAELMIEARHDDVAVQAVGAGADEVVGVGRGCPRGSAAG